MGMAYDQCRKESSLLSAAAASVCSGRWRDHSALTSFDAISVIYLTSRVNPLVDLSSWVVDAVSPRDPLKRATWGALEVSTWNYMETRLDRALKL